MKKSSTRNDGRAVQGLDGNLSPQGFRFKHGLASASTLHLEVSSVPHGQEASDVLHAVSIECCAGWGMILCLTFK